MGLHIKRNDCFTVVHFFSFLHSMTFDLFSGLHMQIQTWHLPLWLCTNAKYYVKSGLTNVLKNANKTKNMHFFRFGWPTTGVFKFSGKNISLCILIGNTFSGKSMILCIKGVFLEKNIIVCLSKCIKLYFSRKNICAYPT